MARQDVSEHRSIDAPSSVVRVIGVTSRYIGTDFWLSLKSRSKMLIIGVIRDDPRAAERQNWDDIYVYDDEHLLVLGGLAPGDKLSIQSVEENGYIAHGRYTVKVYELEIFAHLTPDTQLAESRRTGRFSPIIGVTSKYIRRDGFNIEGRTVRITKVIHHALIGHLADPYRKVEIADNDRLSALGGVTKHDMLTIDLIENGRPRDFIFQVRALDLEMFAHLAKPSRGPLSGPSRGSIGGTSPDRFHRKDEMAVDRESFVEAASPTGKSRRKQRSNATHPSKTDREARIVRKKAAEKRRAG
jgi:hypothetical protein